MPKRGSPIPYHGGKSYLAPWIINHMAPHTRYVEPYFGGGSVLFHKPYEGISETVNDLDGRLMNFWRVLQDPDSFSQFTRRVQAVPLSKVEWLEAKEGMEQGSAVDRAVAFFIRIRQARGANLDGGEEHYTTPTSRTRRGMNEQVSRWLSAVESLPEVHSRLKRVEVYCENALEVIKRLDGSNTLFYLDPPYLRQVRVVKDSYAHEATTAHHLALLKLLTTIKGKFLLSGYSSPLYSQYARRYGWQVREEEVAKHSSAKSSKPKAVECLWFNYHVGVE